MTAADVSLRAAFTGDRGRLLAGLLFAEFGTAVQAIAQGAVLPLASRELHGAALYGATLSGPGLAGILFAVLGPALSARLGPRGTLLGSTVVYLVGVLLAVLAPTMALVLAGRLLQGAAAGLLNAFGLNAVGALYEDALRPRVVATFSLAWLLPSIVGPVVNAAVAELAGWRAAMAWPALLVLLARLVIGRSAGLLPRAPGGVRTPYASSLLVLAGLALTALAPGLDAALRLPGWIAGLALATAAAVRVVVVLTAAERAKRLVLGVYTGMIVAYFGGEGLLPLGLIDIAHVGVAGAGAALAAGAVCWSLMNLRPPGERVRRVAPPLAAAGITTALLALAATVLPGLTGPLPLVVALVAWAVAGSGMGLSWTSLSSATFEGAAQADVPALSAAIAFAQGTGGAAASLIGSGFYSVAAGVLPDRLGIGGGYLVTAAVAVATLVVAALLAARPRAAAAPPVR
ncbi:MFS transporter [Amnibacterium sp. CER49]|uniref:MFS transporter n=1 Tax=Amnibacterium sp. CER49 TaxID=3039161 RepID=UPI00244B75DE|nr:MFS transporter [Amnibacterium sp. CER49]MDH2442901.1 MFS transporter [Amnibacterium sp. CER49]